MKLKEILVGLEGLKVRGDLEIDITGLDKDSRNIKEKNFFKSEQVFLFESQ